MDAITNQLQTGTQMQAQPMMQSNMNVAQPQYGQPAGGLTQAYGMPQYTGMMGGSPANTSPMAQQMGVMGQPMTQPPMGGQQPYNYDSDYTFANRRSQQTMGGQQPNSQQAMMQALQSRGLPPELMQVMQQYQQLQGMGGQQPQISGLQQIAQPQPQVGTITGGGNTFPYLMTDMAPKGPGQLVQQPMGGQQGYSTEAIWNLLQPQSGQKAPQWLDDALRNGGFNTNVLSGVGSQPTSATTSFSTSPSPYQSYGKYDATGFSQNLQNYLLNAERMSATDANTYQYDPNTKMFRSAGRGGLGAPQTVAQMEAAANAWAARRAGQQPIGTQTGPRPVSPTTATTGVNPNLHGGLNIKDYMAQVRTLRDAMFAAPIGSSAREAARQQLDAINRRWHGNPAPRPSATSPVRNPNPTAPSPLAVKK